MCKRGWVAVSPGGDVDRPGSPADGLQNRPDVRKRVGGRPAPNRDSRAL